jgi:hypothetical protein
MQGLRSLSVYLISPVSSQYLLRFFRLSRHIRLVQVLKIATFRTNSGDLFSICPRAGASRHVASWHWSRLIHRRHSIASSSLASTL